MLDCRLKVPMVGAIHSMRIDHPFLSLSLPGTPIC